ncbi:MAG: CoA-binding protein [Rhodospirillales bacterium]|nr:CoA-binding protein [Rhodospirillales bacterium]
MQRLAYSDALILGILNRVGTIAMVGASANWNRPSFFAMKYLQEKGYRVIPVNPGLAGQQLLGERVYAALGAIPFPFEMVDIFRNAEAAGPIVDQAIALQASRKIEVVWMQLGVIAAAAAARAEAAGLTVVMDRCPKIEFGRLHSELSWGGFDSGVITAKRRRLKVARP